MEHIGGVIVLLVAGVGVNLLAAYMIGETHSKYPKRKRKK